MTLDLKNLFSKYRVVWRDKGKNVSRGNLVISCPFCNKTTNPDHGEHLAVSAIGEYFCYRNPSHKGRNLPRLFQLLKIPSHEYAGMEIKELPRTWVAKDRDYSSMRFFQPAETNDEAKNYLSTRLFSQPSEVCKKFHLLVSEEGRWAGRIILPLTIGWSGRSMRNHISPKYLSETTQDGFFFYGSGNSSIIIFEGPFDCMKLASSYSQFDTAGKCGNRLSPALLAFLRERKYLSIYHVPDTDIQFSQYYQDNRILSSYCTYANVSTVSLPLGKKDVGEMDEGEVRQWIVRKLSRSTLSSTQ